MKRIISIGMVVVSALGSLTLLWALAGLPAARATSSVQTVAGGFVSSCDETSLSAALAGGGTVTFTTSGPCVITVSATIVITAPTTINGNGRDVTLSGGGARRIITTTSGVGLVTLQNITLTRGFAPGIDANGGAIYVGGDLVLSNTTVISNAADGQGGGVYVTSTLTLNNSRVLNNVSGSNGGGLRVGRGATLNNSLIQGNMASKNGGGLFGANLIVAMTSNNSQFINNVAVTAGGGIYASGPAVLRGTHFLNNTAHDGGGLYVYTLTVASGVFQANTASGSGGGIYDKGPAVITGTQLISNTALGSGGGGGLYNTFSAMTLQNSTLVSNTASNGFGGGINNDIGSSLLIQNSTFFANRATLGGAMSTIDVLTLTNSTLGHNPADAGALYIGLHGLASLYNSIVANGPGEGSDCINAGTIANNVSNLIRDGTCNPSFTGDPLLGSFGNYGGSLPTLPLLPGSPAIDAGNASACLARDQRGVTRPQGSACDLGAFESRGFALSQTGGSNQTVPISFTFPSPLALSVSSSFAEPVNGGRIKFSAPATGAGTNPTVYSATIAGGAASQIVTANGIVGTYHVTATAQGAAPNVTYALTNTDVAIVGLTASNDSPTVLGSATHLTATISAGSNVTYIWSFGDGSMGAGQNPSHTYGALGPYTVIVTATNSVSQKVATTAVTVIDAPITGLTATNDSPTQLTYATHFTATIATGTSVTYVWNFGDATPTEAGAAVTHTYALTGTYTAVVTATNTRGNQVATTQVMVVNVPITGLTVNNDSPTQVGNTTRFTATIATGANVSYDWDFGDGTPMVQGAGPHLTHDYAVKGPYTATITARNNVYTQVAQSLVTVVDIPIAGLAASNDSPTHLNTTTHFSATITAGVNVVYHWNFGDGSPVAFNAGQHPTHGYASLGTYTATVTATNIAYTQVRTTIVKIWTAPIADAGPAQTMFTRRPVQLNGSASSDAGGFLPLIYRWTQTGGPTVVLSSAVISRPTFTAPTVIQTTILTFSLTVTNTLNFASLPDTVAITVVPYRILLPLVMKQ